MLHDATLATLHLPRIQMGLRCLYSMREGEPIASTIRAVELALNKLGLEVNIYETIRKSADEAANYASVSDTTVSRGIQEPKGLFRSREYPKT